VRETLREALSIYHVDGDRLRELRPDVILTQSLCDVCAVSLEDVERAVASWIGARPRIVSMSPATLADVGADVVRVGEACEVAEKGRQLANRLAVRMAAIAELTKGGMARTRGAAARAPGAAPRPTVACVEWIDPLMAAGNWTPELVALAGGVSLFGVAGRHSPGLAWDDLRRGDPDVIVVMPCGFDLERTRREIPALIRRPGWSRLKAARAGRVCLADGSAYFNRPGPRLVESLEILAEIVHPGLVRFGHEGGAWERLA